MLLIPQNTRCCVAIHAVQNILNFVNTTLTSYDILNGV